MILNITVKVRKKNANLYDYSIVAEKVKTEIDYFRNVHKHKDLEWLQTNMRKNKQTQLQSETSFILIIFYYITESNFPTLNDTCSVSHLCKPDR